MPTDTDKKLNGTPEPFRRPMVWGRPPATIFRAGPLPKGGALPPLSEAPQMQLTPGILSGSMIPRAGPAPAITRPPGPREPQTAVPAPAASAANPDQTVRPLPAAAPQEPVRPVTPTPVPETAAPAPVKAEVATGGTARKPSGRTALFAGIAIAVVAVLAVVGWIWSRPSAVPPAPAAVTGPAPAVLVPEAAAPAIPPTSAPISEPATAPVPATATPPARATTPVPATTRTPEPVAVRPVSPPPEVVAQPPAATTPPPVIVIAPPAPTEAERPSTDPEAPIATRPQPIG